jgi:hypothetical protein
VEHHALMNSGATRTSKVHLVEYASYDGNRMFLHNGETKNVDYFEFTLLSEGRKKELVMIPYITVAKLEANMDEYGFAVIHPYHNSKIKQTVSVKYSPYM